MHLHLSLVIGQFALNTEEEGGKLFYCILCGNWHIIAYKNHTGITLIVFYVVIGTLSHAKIILELLFQYCFETDYYLLDYNRS